MYICIYVYMYICVCGCVGVWVCGCVGGCVCVCARVVCADCNGHYEMNNSSYLKFE